jgi:hypothetical protein
MPKRGRKELYKEDFVRQAEFLGSMGMELKDIAAIFDVTPATMSRYQKCHPELRQAYNNGRAKLKDLIGKKYIKKVEEGNWDAIKEGLKYLHRWKDDSVNVLNVGGNVSVNNINNVNILSSLNEEELSQLAILYSRAIERTREREVKSVDVEIQDDQRGTIQIQGP